MESHIHGNVNVWFGGGDTHVPTGYDGLYPTRKSKKTVLLRKFIKRGTFGIILSKPTP
jgi:hypothetical protein